MQRISNMIVIFCLIMAFLPAIGISSVPSATRLAKVSGTLPHDSNGPGNSDQSGDEWPMFHAALNHTGTAKTTPAQGSSTTWSYKTRGAIALSSPAVVSGYIYIGSSDYNVYCLNAATGAKVWSYPSGSVFSSSPAVAGGYVYIGSDYGFVYCLNATTGALVWSNDTGNTVTSSPVVAGGIVYVGCYDYKVRTLNAATGTFGTSYATGGQVSESPAIANGCLYVGSWDKKVYCWNIGTTTPTWTRLTGGSIDSSPAVAGGFVYVGSEDKYVYRLNASTGAVNWSRATGGAVDSSPAVANGYVYVGSNDNKTYCLNAATGAIKWTFTTGWYVPSSPAVVGGYVYVGSEDKKVYCLNASTGALVWSYTTGNYVDCSPAVANGHVFFGSYDCNVTCLPMLLEPTAPQNVHATGGNGQVTLTWLAPATINGETITGYRVYQGTSSGGETFLRNPGNVLTCTSTSLVGGQKYFYIVQAVTTSGNGANSTEVNAMTSKTVPGPPAGLSTIPANGHVFLSWLAPSSNGGDPIKGYIVYKGTTTGNEQLFANITTPATTSCNVTGLTNGQTYYFSVLAYNSQGKSTNATASCVPATVPGVPRAFGVISNGNGWVYLTWLAPASDGGASITGYLVFKGATTGDELLLANITTPATTSLNCTGLANGTTYYFSVQAYNSQGRGANATTTNRVATVPSIPLLLQATPGNGQVTLSWTKPADNGGSPITNYTIYMGISPGSELFLTTIGNVTSYTVTGLINGKVHYFTVAAVNAIGTGANATETSATPSSLPSGGGATPGYSTVLVLSMLAVTCACLAIEQVKRRRA